MSDDSSVVPFRDSLHGCDGDEDEVRSQPTVRNVDVNNYKDLATIAFNLFQFTHNNNITIHFLYRF